MNVFPTGTGEFQFGSSEGLLCFKPCAGVLRAGLEKCEFKSSDHFRKIVLLKLFLLSFAIFICVLKKRDLWFNLGAIGCFENIPAFWNGVPMIDAGSISIRLAPRPGAGKRICPDDTVAGIIRQATLRPKR